MKQPPAVFSLLDTSALGGAETYLLSNLEYFAHHGCDVVLATNCSAVKQAVAAMTLPNSAKIQVVDLPFRLDAIGNWKGLLKFFVTAPYAIYWLFKLKQKYLQDYSRITCLLPGFSDRLFFTPWLKYWGYRILWLEYGPLEPTFARNFGFPRWLYNQTKHLPDQIITISQTTRTSLVKTGTIDPKKISIVYPGVAIPSDHDRQQFQKQATSWLKRHHLQNKPLIIAIGRLATEKEFPVLLTAFKHLTVTTQLKPHLIMIGDGPEKENLQQLIKKFALTNEVTLTGFITNQEKSVLLSAADVFVFPSAWPLEGFGMTTIEAMSFALPTITTGAGPQAEIVTDQHDGLYFKARDVQDLAQTIETLLSHQKLSRSLAQQASKTARTRFDETRMQREMFELL